MCIILKFTLLMEQFFVHNIIILSYILNFTQANCLELSLFTPSCFGLSLFIPFNLTVCQNSCKCQTNISPISFRRNNYHYFCSTLSSLYCFPMLPWRSSPQDGSPACLLLLVYKTWRVPHQSIESCDPKTTLPVNTDSDSRSESIKYRTSVNDFA